MSLRAAPQKPMRLRKGLLFFALACVLLWVSMWLSRSLAPPRANQEHVYALDGKAWEGIDRVELQGIDSGSITMSAQERPRLVSRNDDSLQPRLALVRQGNTLVISAKPNDAQKDVQTRGRRSEVRIENLYLPLQVQTIEGPAYLSVRMAETQEKAKEQALTLIGQNIHFNGDIAHLQVQLHPSVQAPTCGKEPGWAARLSVRSDNMQTLGIQAPNRSQIELELGAQNWHKEQNQQALPKQLAQITLQTGAESRLELQPLALLDHMERLPAADAKDTPDCPKASATDQAAEYGAASTEPDDYSD